MAEILNSISPWLSLISLIAAIPIGICANLATPKIQSWFTQRSVVAIQERINKLENKLKFTDELTSKPSYAIGRFALSTMAILSVYFVFTMLLNVLTLFDILFFLPRRVNNSTEIISVSEPFFLLGILFGVIVGIAGGYVVTPQARNFLELCDRVTETDKWKEKTLREIEMLKRRLPPANQAPG